MRLGDPSRWRRDGRSRAPGGARGALRRRPPLTARYDAAIVGGGHNGLVAAALIARAGFKAVVLEAGERLGGAAVSEEFHPGYTAPTVAHTAGPLARGLEPDLGLDVAWLPQEPRVWAPLPDDDGLELWGDVERSAASLRRLSPRDADRFPGFAETLGRVAGPFARVRELTPPDLDRPAGRDVLALLRLAIDYRRLGRADAHRLLRWLPMPVADFVEEWFETPLLRALLAARGVRGMMAGPRSAGTTMNLLMASAAEGGHAAGSSVFVRGGLGSLVAALATAAGQLGVEIRTGARVARIVVEGGRATGVVLASGDELSARAVVSGTDPKRACLELLDPALLDPDERWRIANYRIAGMASKLNLALDGLPERLRSRDGAARTRLHVGADIDWIERAFDAAKHGGLPERPTLDVTIPSLVDDSLAPAGHHVMSIYVQHTPYRLQDGTWEGQRDALADRVLATLAEYAPGLTERVVARQALTPVDLERSYGLNGGHPLHGEPSLDQLFTMRPLLGWGRYRGPLPGLYFCSAGAHPGGGVNGAPGRNAAREIVRDLA